MEKKVVKIMIILFVILLEIFHLNSSGSFVKQKKTDNKRISLNKCREAVIPILAQLIKDCNEYMETSVLLEQEVIALQKECIVDTYIVLDDKKESSFTQFTEEKLQGYCTTLERNSMLIQACKDDIEKNYQKIKNNIAFHKKGL